MKMLMRYSTVAAAAAVALSLGAWAQTRPAASPAPAAESALAPVKGIVIFAPVIPSSDFDRSRTFYAKGMGMTAGPGANPSEMSMTLPGGGPILMLQKVAAGTPLPARASANRVILQVPNIKALSDQLVAAGFPPIAPINVIAQHQVSVATLKDPDGNSYELIQRGL